MTWLRLDDGFSEHRKVIDLSDAAFRLHVSALCFCARNLTDGFLSEAASHRCYPKPKAAIAELLQAKLWTRTSSGYTIHDYLTYNPTRERVAAEREAAKIRMRGNIRAKFGRSSGEVHQPVSRTPVSIDTGTTRTGVFEEKAGGNAPRMGGGLRHIREALR